MCKKLFERAREYSATRKVKGPIEIMPSCHKKAHIDVFLDPRKMTVIISCSRCERKIEEFKVKGTLT